LTKLDTLPKTPLKGPPPANDIGLKFVCDPTPMPNESANTFSQNSNNPAIDCVAGRQPHSF
jgi:hypothetical protein